ncbi:MAG TPA: DNA-formamidopyrimidine glycosylase family protein [Mycobacteriales bacterium]|nr:DNA-formamidopyrimidine glycosylase family protein [Mycobacteriales bacterium]
MPEGDTVWLAAKRLHEAFAGEVLTRSDFRIPRLATADLSGRRVLEIVPRGKHMLTRVDAGLTLHTHLEMDGAWRIFDAGARWTGGPGHEIRIVLGTGRRTAVGYRIPVIELIETAQEFEVIGHLGPDLLAADFDAAEAFRRLGAEPDAAIADALLDQRNLAGIGNVYKSEVLFLSGVAPWTPVADVADLTRVVDLARRLLLANRERFQRITTGSRRRGEELWVYGRAGRPCRRCGTSISRRMQGQPGRERVTYWCARCQAGPDVTAAAINDA